MSRRPIDPGSTEEVPAMTEKNKPSPATPPFDDTRGADARAPAPPPSAAPARRAPRDAATLIVVRDAAGDAGGIEVLLLRRVDRDDDRSSGACVFPGGVLEAHDRALHGWCAGLDDATASRRLDLPEHGLDYYVAAIRECFEECGLLFASDAAGRLVDLDALPPGELAALRSAAQQGGLELQRLCERFGLQLAADRLGYLAHWLTPPGLPKRFDTRFFVAALPPGQTPRHDERETVEAVWARPADVLDPASRIKTVPVTRRVLQAIAHFETAAACVDHAMSLGGVKRVMPRMGWIDGRPQPILPTEPPYAELARIDPEGRGQPSARIVPGVAVRLSERVLRITAGNAGAMTGPGTNTYLVGGGAGPGADDGWAVIDPGPDDEAHVAAVLAAAPGPIRWILATHSHKDHSPAAVRLRAATGALVMGRTTPVQQGQDTGFAPDRVLEHGERLAIGGTTLRVLHTPGHASNHLCFLLEEEKLLFTGDHVMQGSTVVINPPDGDMAAYFASLEALLAEDIAWLAPGHGFLVGQPHETVRLLLRHRRHREAKVMAGLRSLGPAPIEALVGTVYYDVPERLHAVAQRSLFAHLLKLAAEGAAEETPGGWRAVASAASGAADAARPAQPQPSTQLQGSGGGPG